MCVFCSRVVNVSSRMGKYSCLGPSLLHRLSSCDLTEDVLDELMNEFKRYTHDKVNSAYFKHNIHVNSKFIKARSHVPILSDPIMLF